MVVDARTNNKMTLYFCTLFDTSYMTRGVALYQSLAAQKIDFRLHISCVDEFTFQYFSAKKYPNIVPVALSDLEDRYPELLAAKADRSVREYCWTSKSFTLRYCFEQLNLPHCAYLDADMYFYDNPELIIREKGSASVIVTPHYYHHEYDQSATDGIYCAQFVYFENNPDGNRVLNWWSTACAKWCYLKVEGGKFGDQKYLDFWPYHFRGVHVNRHHGAGMAPWNALQYSVEVTSPGRYALTLKESGATFPLVFFHFHGLTFSDNHVRLTEHMYYLPSIVRDRIYKDYLDTLGIIRREINAEFPDKNVSGTKALEEATIITCLRDYYRSVRSALRHFLSVLSGSIIRNRLRNTVKVDRPTFGNSGSNV